MVGISLDCRSKGAYIFNADGHFREGKNISLLQQT